MNDETPFFKYIASLRLSSARALSFIWVCFYFVPQFVLGYCMQCSTYNLIVYFLTWHRTY